MTIKTDISPVLGFARMQSGIRTVRSIVLKNTSGTELKDVKVEIRTDPAFAHGTTVEVGTMNPKGRQVLGNVDIALSHEFLSNLSETVRGTVNISVTAISENGERIVVAEETKEVEVLPYDEWEGLSHMPELVASFVLPNHPVVKNILSTASDIMRQMTGDPSLGGYINSTPERVYMQMEAIYRAVSTLRIAYSNAPASFQKDGQRIRMPEEIISNLLATCMDSALLYSACLEAAGIHPVMVFTTGHAFSGAWLVPESYPYAVCDDVTTLSKHVADGINDLVLVETTGSDEGNDRTFSEAVVAGKGNIYNPEDFDCMVDIVAARKLGIRPLPLRVKTPGGYEIVMPAEAVDEGDKILPDRDEIDLDTPSKPGKKTLWERKLLDLTLRNNLVNVHTTTNCVQLVNADNQMVANALEQGDSFQVFGIPDDDWTGASLKKGIMVAVPKVDSLAGFAVSEIRDHRFHTFLDDNKTDQRVTAIRKAAKSALEESGANTLYLTIGSLRWYDDEGKGPYVAPAILYPVELAGVDNRLSKTDDEPMVNLTLLEMLRQKFGITIPGLDKVGADGHVEVHLVLNTLRRAVMDRKGWDVDDLLFLGNFNFSKFIIWNDIHTHTEMLEGSDCVSSLLEGRLKVKDVVASVDGKDLDKACSDSDILFPISADSSQMKAVLEAIKGRSFVMHGPPGTGKSQTITNIIANALYHGQRVLFVSEKMAALEVVQSRLEALGLDPFCLELHSNKTKKSVVMKKLEATLELPRNIETEGFEQAVSQDLAYKTELNNHVRGLHGGNLSGLTLYDCLSGYISMGEGPEGRFPNSVMASLGTTGLVTMENALKDYAMAIEHSSVTGASELIDMPMAEYTPEYVERLESVLADVVSSRGFIGTWLSERRLERFLGVPIGAGLSNSKISAVKSKAQRWLGSLSEARHYAIYSKYRNAMRTCGLGFVADAYEKGKVNTDGLVDFYRRSLYHSYGEFLLSKESGLNLFCGDIFESRIKRFREFAEGFREQSRKEIFAKAASRIPDVREYAAKDKEMNLLLKVIRNGCRGMSLRTLFSSIPNLLPKVCPCMLMSPLSVSQYLQSENGQFDLLIFDEASQLPTCEAVASMARAKTVVVVGDPNQLPPTSFFETNFFDEDNADIEDLDSILDDSLAMPLPSNYLRWHYRSRHESLIAFSNANYYGNSLLTFPSNDDLRSMVTFQKVEGTYDRGRTRQNIAEAEAIVEDIKRRLSDPALKSQTIGVVTFSVTQQAAIENRLDDMFRRYTMLKKAANELPEPIFVKNLESVQGDERDVILFSVGYGVDSKGRVPMNFGPLNQTGGWRRLNVAVSRARREMKVFSSILPEQMPVSGLSRGVADLRAFLTYAIEGRESLETVAGDNGKTDSFVDMLADELRNHGQKVNTHIGSSDFRIDIGIVDPSDSSRYVKGIIVDGPAYASAQTAGDREIIRPSVLEGLGWKLERIWILDRYGK